ncbi:MAG: cell division protein ZapA [Thermodesulfovibrionales bacterium]|nr:cell division protein ZapA [Thermodesulfovibrionales bacterium]
MGNAEVHILGQKYVIKGEGSEEHIKHIADYVDKKLKEAYASHPNVTPLKAAILTALNIADELDRIKAEYNAISSNIKNIEDKADAMIKLFD